jgi:hypothetical protein
LYQVQDYGIALKLGDGALILTCMVRLLKVFLCLHNETRQSEYITGVVTQMRIFASWIESNGKSPDVHPILQQWLMEPSVFNEEAGEISLSVMSRGMSAVGSCSDINTYQTEFQAMHDRMKAAKDLKIEMSSEDIDDRRERKEEMTDAKVKPELDAITSHFKTVLRKVKSNSWRPVKGRWALFNTQVAPADGPLVLAKVAMKKVPMVEKMFLTSTIPKLTKAMSITTRDLDNHDWVAKFGSDKWGVDKDDNATDSRQGEAEDDGKAPPPAAPRPKAPKKKKKKKSEKKAVAADAAWVAAHKDKKSKQTKRKLPAKNNGPGFGQPAKKKRKAAVLDESLVGKRVLMPGNWWKDGDAKESFPGFIKKISQKWEGHEARKTPQMRFIVHLDDDLAKPSHWGVAKASIAKMIKAAKTSGDR